MSRPSVLLHLLLLPTFVASVAAQCSSARKPACAPEVAAKDIVQTALAAGSFETLTAALEAAGLVDTLRGAGPFTVFAPTDSAFARLAEGTVASLLEPQARAQLTSILTHHVVAGRLDAAQVLRQSELTTLGGQRLSVRQSRGQAFVGNALVTTTDIHCANGIIHVIDTVLLPEPAAVTPVARVSAGACAAEALCAFPQVEGRNLEETDVTLPEDFTGEVNLVLVAFERWQQEQVDQWLPLAGKLAEHFDGFAYYELPVLSKTWNPLRGWIDSGMASGIADRAARERTITLYIDKQPFLESLEIASEKSIQALIVDRHGCVLWRHVGTPGDDSARELEAFLDRKLTRTVGSR